MKMNAATNMGSDVDEVVGLDRFLPLEEGAHGCGAAAYLGCNSIICRLYDLQSGELVTHTSASGNYASMSGVELKETLTDMFETLGNASGISLSKINVAVVSGTTAMESRAAGVGLEQLVHDGAAGCDNFGCDVEYMLAGSTAIAVGQAFFVPCLDDSIGGDFLCSLLAIDILGSEDPVLFISGDAHAGSGARIAYGNQEAISVCVLPEDSDVQQGLARLLELCDAEYDHISRAVVAGEEDLAVPPELMNHLRRIEYPAIVGTSAVLLSEDAEDELCRIASECHLISL